MKFIHSIYFIAICNVWLACTSSDEIISNKDKHSTDYLRIRNEKHEIGFIDFKGDTIIPLGKYQAT